jgi:hypothetical protein
MILTSDDQVHPDTHVLTMVNNVIEVVNYVIAARPSLLNFMIADSCAALRRPNRAYDGAQVECEVAPGRHFAHGRPAHKVDGPTCL